MEILENKYISPDEVKYIALQLKPNKLLLFCQVNRLTRTICQDDRFLVNYIHNQKRYNDLIKAIVKQGNIILFKRLWGATTLKIRGWTMTSDPYLLSILTDLAYYNGHVGMSEYCFSLDKQWTYYKQQLEKSDLPINVERVEDDIYKLWGDRINYPPFEEYKFILDLREALSTGSGNIFREDPRIKDHSLPHSVIDTFSYADSLATINNFYPDQANRLNIVNTLKIGNFSLAEEFINKYPFFRNFNYLKAALESNSKQSLVFIGNNLGDKFPLDVNSARFPKIIGNKDVLFYLLQFSNTKTKKKIILKSFAAFDDPDDYIDLIIDELKCLEKKNIFRLEKALIEAGHLALAKMIFDEIPICQKNDIK